jgi:hypothetical protein
MYDAVQQLAAVIAAEAARKPKAEHTEIVAQALAEVEGGLVVPMGRDFKVAVMMALEAAVWKELIGLCPTPARRNRERNAFLKRVANRGVD